LFKEGNQIAIEYQKGAPHVSPMAYDSKLGKLGHTVTFEPKRKVARDAMPRPGIQHSRDIMNEDPLDNRAVRRGIGYTDDDNDDDGDEIVTKLMSYLNDKLTPEQLSSVAAILGAADAPDSDVGEPRSYAADSDRATDRRRTARLAADAARSRPMSAADDAAFAATFPGALLIKNR
jgi:hypothetical protein